MRTELDDADMWFVHAVVFDDELRVILSEGFRSEEPQDVRVGGYIFQGAYPIGLREQSRYIVVRFARCIAWQVVDESYTALDAYEQGDQGVLRVLERSRYLDYVNRSHGWYVDVVGPATHYRLWTGNQIIDAVAGAAPTLEPWTPPDGS